MIDKQSKILIVDDDDTIRNMYVAVFHKEGFQIMEAVDGLEGLDKAMKEKPDIIFTGIIMPRMDGFALVSELKKKVETAGIPVVMNSHMGRKEDQDRAKELGVKDFLVQGMVTPKFVVERIKSLLGSGGYDIKISANDLDAPRLIKGLGFREGLICEKCQTEMVLRAQISDVDAKEIFAKFICPKCG
jgi:PleD family two-component response regulator